MVRLLISLYLVVFTSIVVINQASDYVWQNWVTHAPDELRHAKQIAHVMQAHITAPEQLQMSYQGLDIDSIAWLDEQRTQLLNGEVLTTYNAQGQALLSFLLIDNYTLVQLGPFLPSEPASNKLYLFKFISFLVLGLLLIVWLRPLWLDLMQFKRVTEQLAQGNLNVERKASRFSAISDLTEQFHIMAHKVANLMTDQKQLVNAVSHELRTPLARLKFALAMLQSAQPEQISGMQQDVQEMESLIDEMLSYARLEIAGEQISCEWFNLSELFLAQLDKLQGLSSKEITTSISSGVLVNANAHYLARVLQNLLQNADKYGASQIDVSLREVEQQVIIVVEDDGEGIAEDQYESVFMPFVRLEKSRNKHLGGYGLGLAIVKKIVSWHKGQCVVAKSKLGGASFVITLPK
ncbi:ATP-binding protein [Pseudoalteromonas sp. MTN2-4]|uniref:ATP-binding protein n=1 Tax=Pseudoalteromonas sp. MTN2-4 TaxID=3056555 RepID=UPI0036F24D74